MLVHRRLVPSLCSAALVVGLLAPTRTAAAAPELPPSPPVTPTQPGGVATPATPAETTTPSAPPAEAHEVSVLRVEAGEDEVILLDGSFVRGKVVELAKGSHVTIEQDEKRRIPWAELQEVRLGTKTTQPAPAPDPTAKVPAEHEPPLAVLAEGAEQPSPGRPRVHLASRNGRPVTLYSIDGEFVGAGAGVTISGISYRAVCTGTCDRIVDGSRGGAFFVGGERVTPSRRFTLADDSGDLTLDVKAGRPGVMMTGVVLSSVGASLLVGGLVMLPFVRDVPTLRPTSVGLSVGGAMGLATGVVLALVGRTVVKKIRAGR